MRKIAPFDRKAHQTLYQAEVLDEFEEDKNAKRLREALQGAQDLCGPDGFEGDVIRVLADSLAATKWCPDLLIEHIGRRNSVPDVWYDWLAGYAVNEYRD